MNENKLKDALKEEIRLSQSFLNQNRQDIEKINLNIKYYEGQIDALNLALKTLEIHIDEK